jgi:hypothetical protein
MTALAPHDRQGTPRVLHSLHSSLAPVGPAPSGFAPALLIDPQRNAWSRVPAVRHALAVLGCVALVGAVLGGSRVTHLPVAEPVAHVVSGTPGIRATTSGKNERWADGRVTIVIDGSVRALGESADDAVKAAFGAWAASDASLPALMFDVRDEHGHAARDGVNRILVAPITLAGHEKDVAVTIAYANDATGQILEADIILNAAYPFRAVDEVSDDSSHGKDCGLRYDVQNIMTHESGHFFGLGEDLTDPKASMYFRSAPCETHKRNLTESDRGTMASLYKVTESSPADPSAPPPAAGGCN